MGVTLVQRTTRSVRLTEAGQRFYAAVHPLLEDLREAVEEVGELAAQPNGVLRLHVSTAAERFLAGPVLTDFLVAHPHIRLALAVSGEGPDIEALGHDAGVEVGEGIDRGMIAGPGTVGDAVEVYVEGGSRHGREVLRALALGARAVALGRPAPWALAADRSQGVRGLLTELVELAKRGEDVIELDRLSGALLADPETEKSSMDADLKALAEAFDN